DGELVQVGYEHGPVGIGPALLERCLPHRTDVNIMHPAEILKQRARFVDDHRVDMEPVPVAGRWQLDVVGRLRGETRQREPGRAPRTAGAISASLCTPIDRDSPDEFQTGINVRVFPALLQDRREVLTATSTSGSPNTAGPAHITRTRSGPAGLRSRIGRALF